MLSMLVVPADGTLALAQFLAQGRALLPYAALFANDYVPDHTTTLANLTEASFPGYSRLLLGSPTSVVGQADGTALMRWAPVIWDSAPGAPQKSYGYYVVQLDATLTLRLLWVERMSPVMDWSAPNQQLALNPQFVTQTLFG